MNSSTVTRSRLYAHARHQIKHETLSALDYHECPYILPTIHDGNMGEGYMVNLLITVQLNLSNTDTEGTEQSVRIREVTLKAPLTIRNVDDKWR